MKPSPKRLRQPAARFYRSSERSQVGGPTATRRGILDIGCGNGVAIGSYSRRGSPFYGVDAPEALVAKFAKRFPHITVLQLVEESSFFPRAFRRRLERGLIANVAPLKTQWHFLFTSPGESCSWMHGMTGLPSTSTGTGNLRTGAVGAPSRLD
jgi:trans-aconitate methyltransferase